MNQWLVSAVLLAAFVAPAAAQDDPGRPVRIGFVDLKRAFYAFHRTKKLENDLNAFKDTLDKQLEEEGKALARLRTSLEGSDLTTAWGKEQERALLLKTSKFEFNKRWANGEISEKLNRMTVELYLSILDAVREHAEATGVDAVFQVDTEPLRASSPDELKLLMRSRGVLYFRKPLDLTDAVIRLLNRDAPVVEPRAGGDPEKDPKGAPPQDPAPPQPPSK